MKKLIIIAMAIALTGCSTVKDDGSLTLAGKILEWTADEHSPVQQADSSFDPYAAEIDWQERDGIHPKAESEIEYNDDFIPVEWTSFNDGRMKEWGCPVTYYETFPDYKEYDITDCNWTGGGANRLHPEIYRWNHTYRGYQVRDFRREGRWIVGMYKDYGGRIDGEDH